MAKNNSTPKPGLKQEALAVLGIFVSLFLYLSIISYSLKTSGNWCGETGTLIAQVLIGFTGWGAYLLPALLLFSSFLFFSQRMSFQRLPQVVAGLTGAVLSFCGMLSSLTIKDPAYLDAGGFLGKTGFTLLSSVVGHGGTVLVFMMVFLISLMLSSQFSPYQLMASIKRLIWRFIKSVFGLFAKNEDKKLERKQQTNRRIVHENSRQTGAAIACPAGSADGYGS